MKTEIMNITPLRAETILKKSKIRNRMIRESHVDFLASQMTNNQWIENSGESLIFTDNGGLIDGQHRMLAIIKSNKSFDFLVVRGASEDSFTVIDSGMCRGGSDALHIDGVKNSRNTATIIRGWLLVKSSTFAPGPGSWGKKKTTNQEVLQVYKKDPEYWDSTQKQVYNWYKSFNKLISVSLFAPIYVIIEKKVGYYAFIFFDELCNMKFGDGPNDPLRRFTNHMVRDSASIKKYNTRTKRALLIKTWNAYYQKKKIKSLKFTDGDSFPAILP